MDVPPVVAPVAPRPRRRMLKTVLLIVAVIGATIMGVILAVETGAGTPLGFTHMAVRYTPNVLAPLEELGRFQFFPQRHTVTAPGSPLHVIDMASSKDATYYLLYEPTTLSSNVYVSVKGAPVTQVTYTQTFKQDLSYDPTGNTLAYISRPINSVREIYDVHTHDVVVFPIASGAERILGNGDAAEFLTGGVLVVRKGDELLEMQLTEGHEPIHILTLDGTELYAVSRTQQTIALYNPVSHAIDFFDAKTSGTATYSHSLRIGVPPSALTYAGNNLIVAGVAPGEAVLVTPGLFGSISLPLYMGKVGISLIRTYE